MNANKIGKYLEKENPLLVDIPENKLVPVILSDSKGRYLRQQAATPLEHDIVWADQWHESGRTTKAGLDWVKRNVKNFDVKYPNGFILFVWLGTCNYCEKNANNQLFLKDNIARVSAEIILDLGKIIRLGQEHNFQVILLEIPVFCTKEWNKLHGHRTPEEFDEQDQRLFQDIKLVNEEIQRLNLDSGKVSPMFNVDLKLKRNRITPNRSYYNFSQFMDGIHPNPLLSCYWLRRIVELVRAECY